MNSKEEILGLIPARGGSKGIPRKNLALLDGRSLLAYTCEAARASQLLTRIILSTDDSEIAEVGRQCGIEIPFLRPADLARDETSMFEVIQDVLQTLDKKEDYQPEVVVLLQPTSPLRRAEHIDAAIELLFKTNADSVVSVTEVPHQFTPGSLICLEDGKLAPFSSKPQVLRRQDKPRLYARNGPAVLAVRTRILIQKKSLYGDDCRPLVMEAEESIDIDYPHDIELAEFFLSRLKSK